MKYERSAGLLFFSEKGDEVGGPCRHEAGGRQLHPPASLDCEIPHVSDFA